MHLANSIVEFLHDKNYFIAVYENKIYIFKYQELVMLTDNKIILLLPKFTLNIKGTNLFVKQMNKDEILIEGNILEIGKSYE